MLSEAIWRGLALAALALLIVAGTPWLRERRNTRRERAAEVAALHRHERRDDLERHTVEIRGFFATPEEREAHRVRAELIRRRKRQEAEDRRSVKAWQAHYDAAIADLNARFDALTAGMPRDETAPFDPGFWPAVSAPEHGPDVAHVDLVTLAEFDPASTLDLIRRDAAPVFSWTTQEIPKITPSKGVVKVSTQDRRRQRRLARRAQLAPSSPIPH